MGNRKRIPFPTIAEAKVGGPEAMTAILRHYERYIAHFSKRPLFDEYGNHYEFVDAEIKQRIESKLMLQIFYKFDCTRLPAGETLELD